MTNYPRAFKFEAMPNIRTTRARPPRRPARARKKTTRAKALVALGKTGKIPTGKTPRKAGVTHAKKATTRSLSAFGFAHKPIDKRTWSKLGPAARNADTSPRLTKFVLTVERGVVRDVEILEDLPPREAAPAPATAPAIEAALQAARDRGTLGIAGLLKRPEMLTDRAFAARLGVSHTTVHARRRNKQVLAVGGAARGFRYPDWQIDPRTGQPYAQIVRLLALLDDPWVAYRMLAVVHHRELDGRTGLEALQQGRGDALVQLVERQFPD
ncbi:MAG: hypothetical protein JWM77_558 [Rhodospirillales bacterium]|nr:hypothetical protein [Rhodospirillales bacterium]